MKEKKRRQLLGDAVCGFVNAQTTDEAYFPILASIQNIFDFSPSFIEEIKKVFPAMWNITPPPKARSEEWDLMSSLEDKVLSALKEKLGPPLELSCNRHDQSLVISLPSSKFEDFWKLPHSKRFPFVQAMRTPSGLELLGIDFSPPWSGKSEFRYLDEPYVTMASEVYKAKPSTLEPDVESAIDEIFYAELNLRESWTRYNTIELHDLIQIQQETMRELLDLVIHDRRLGGDSRFFAYLQIYNKMPRSKIEFDMQDNLKEPYPIREEDYFRINLPIKWLDRIESDLAYCLIEFLMPEGNRKYIGKCPYCRQFFIKKQTNRVKCYSDDCEKTYQARKKRKQRDKDPVKYL
jgi:hypothetical protein